tara:strand:- start:418 stop:924 length:507 start_codon:yes stop_codon:yes gene_type:complete
MTAINQFNENLVNFVEKLKNIVGENDKDLIAFSEYCDLMHINARILIQPFQLYISNDVNYVKNILKANRQFFITYDFINDSNVASYKQAQTERKEEIIFKIKNIINKVPADQIQLIFDSLKLLIYFSLLDQYKSNEDSINIVHKYLELCLSSTDNNINKQTLSCHIQT